MKKFIDKETNEIVTLLTVDEARKIFKMYINYSQGKQEVKLGRINLVDYLGDFVKYANEADLAKFYDTLVKEKDGFELGKQEQKGYDMLLNFFEIYSAIQKGDITLSKVTSYIASNIDKQESISKKQSNNEELNFEENISRIFFGTNFDLKTLAKKACEIWNENLRKKIEQNTDGIEISLQEEIAYQELYEISSGKVPTKKNISNQVKEENKEKIVTSNEEEIKDEKIKEELKEKNDEAITGPIVMGQINEDEIKGNDKNVIEEKVREDKQSENNTNQENDVIGPIFVNAIDNEKQKENKSDKDKKSSNEDEIIGGSKLNQQDSTEEEKQSIFNSKKNDETINSNNIRQATSDVSLRDAAGFFNNTVDRVNNNNGNNNNNDDNTNNSSNLTSSESSIPNIFASSENKTLRDE